MTKKELLGNLQTAIRLVVSNAIPRVNAPSKPEDLIITTLNLETTIDKEPDEAVCGEYISFDFQIFGSVENPTFSIFADGTGVCEEMKIHIIFDLHDGKRGITRFWAERALT